MTSATGIAIGRRDGEKLYIYDVMLTPNPESVQSDIKQVQPNGSDLESKNLQMLLLTKYNDFNYSDWLVEFHHSVSLDSRIILNCLQVQRMLTTGIEVLGLFVYCSSAD